ncbi:MAG TPA: phospho-N-acetylmuramoyl-pentapeptide-transferase [Candidatus Ratteibacteria bacterium]|nr:phospho-N-acetylmuramoyl-pentapeptide-transferase [bacterium]HOQ81848.1 phospho-N-acetylmuramoyl-pentapeptide-transferase [bacterium]HRS06661.1 phospho-N-acetylmuramoyl-pentapeptide-transferase [Candidatus Ratteibacteria bacterium]HRV05006.1 phospho-N-acetylmuramoyl-pentapeptide-transferase [Candidatus Ratteibacteria bacterium]
MIYFLVPYITDFFSPFNVFRYITVRTVCSSLTSLFICLFLFPSFIRRVKHFSYPKMLEFHQNKEKTPTMGGLLIVWSILASNFLWADLKNVYVLMLILTLCWLGLLGFLDDYLKLTKMNPKGLRPRSKIIGQIGIGFILGLILYYHPVLNFSSRLYVPFFKHIFFDLGPYYVLFTVFIIVATSNAVNLTDGLDGLAAGTIIMATIALGFIVYTVGNVVFADYLNLPFVSGIGETAVFCGSIVGAVLGFLWYNCYPAEIFMGDTGSLPLGGCIGLLAIIGKQEISLIIIGGIFVVEALSVVIQVISFKTRRKRVFLMTPLHHHFELRGWKEPQVVVRFWILAIIFTLFTLVTLKIR